MQIEASSLEGVRILAPQGRLDANTAALFQERLLMVLEGEPRVVLDFLGISYLSSAGLRALMLGGKKAQKLGGWIRIARVRSHVEEIFTLSGFDTFFPLFSELEQAVLNG